MSENINEKADLSNNQKLKLAKKIIDYVRDELIISLPYFNRAILKMPVEFYEPKKFVADDFGGFATDMKKIYADINLLISDFKANRITIARKMLHSIFHCLYKHPFNYNRLNTKYWDFACDVAVELAIMDLNIDALKEPQDTERETVWHLINKNVEHPYAEKIYEFMMSSKAHANDWMQYARLFKKDHHEIWKKSGLVEQEGNFLLPMASNELDQLGMEWERVFRNVKKDKETVEKGQGRSIASVTDVLGRIEGDNNDYTDFLMKFAKLQEEVRVNDDEFDYIYYTYGMQLYENMPLIEPLEYKETLKIYDFVIAIDTSGSCRGRVVKNFLRRTYSILRNKTVFGTRINVHILQCDNTIQSETVLRSDEEFERYISNVEVVGSGGTDFRPVFERVNELKDMGEFSDLRGLLYLSDGLGIFPSQIPEYKTAFIIMPYEDMIPNLPDWVISKVVSREDLDR